MTKLLQFLGLVASEQEQEILRDLQKYGKPSMKVVGRGTLTMSVADAKDSDVYRRLCEQTSQLIER